MTQAPTLGRNEILPRMIQSHDPIPVLIQALTANPIRILVLALTLLLTTEAMIAEALTAGRLGREPEWTEAIGVGSREFVDEVAARMHRRVQQRWHRNARHAQDGVGHARFEDGLLRRHFGIDAEGIAIAARELLVVK